MLTFEYAKERFMLENGQLLIPFPSLKLDDDRLEKIFKNVIKKLNNKRPIRDILDSYVDANGIYMENALGVLALKYKIYSNFDRQSAPMSRSYFWFNPTTRVLTTLFGCEFIIVYLREHQLGYYPQKETAMTTVEGETDTYFYLNGAFKDGTLVLTKKHYGTGITTTATVTGVNENTATLSGTLGTGTVDLTTLKVDLTLTDTTAGNVIATYTNKRVACNDLDQQDSLFQLMFDIDVLKSFGSLKAQANLSESTGLPFSLLADTMLERARQLETELKTTLENKSNWWQWGF